MKLNTPERVRDWKLYKRTVRSNLKALVKHPGMKRHVRFFNDFNYGDQGRPLFLCGARSDVDPVARRLVKAPATPDPAKKNEPKGQEEGLPEITGWGLCHFVVKGDGPTLIIRITRGKIRKEKLKKLLRQIGLQVPLVITASDDEGAA